LRELWGILAVGFCLQDLAHQFGGFLEELLQLEYYLQVGTTLKEGGHLGDSYILRYREFYLIYDLETSPRGLWQLDLSS
jgi:hypothetical protein